MDYSPWGHKALDTTEHMAHFYIYIYVLLLDAWHVVLNTYLLHLSPVYSERVIFIFSYEFLDF